MAAARGDIRIGISGWRYAPWRGVLYPYVYFDNDLKVRAPFDAEDLARRLGIETPHEQVA